MEKPVEIKRIVIRIGDKEASLTPDEARGLRDVLDAMFGEKAKEKEYIAYPYPFYPHWTNPYWVTYRANDTAGNLEWNGTLYISNTALSQYNQQA